MIAIAAVTGPLPRLGVIAIGVLVAVVLTARTERSRALAMLATLVASPPLLLASIWHSPKLSIVHHHPLLAVALGVLGLAVVVALAVAFDRRPEALAVLAVATLPFRVTIGTGSGSSNLLVPLYVVVGAGVLAYAFRALRGEPALGAREREPGGWLERLLAAFVLLYALQAAYSPGAGLQQAMQNMSFFYAPFALLFCVLRRLEWTPQRLRWCLAVIGVLAVAFAAVGFLEYATRTTYLSSKVAQQNQLYAYFVVNSVFFDPNIFGRFLSLAMVVLAVVLLYDRPAREQLTVAGVLAVLWGGLVLSFSRASMVALLIGLGVLAANKWRPTRALIVGAAVIVIGAAAVAISPKTFGLNEGFNGVSAGRGSVLHGGLELFADRPLWGFGSGSFQTAYQKHHLVESTDQSQSTLTASHTTPVTIAAEQGLIGELVYIPLVVVAVVGLVRGARDDPARAAIAAAFVALIVHTMLYADFLEDPATWALLGVGVALSRARGRAPARAVTATGRVAVVPA